MGRGEKQQERAGDSTDKAGDQEWQQDSPGHIQVIAVCASARGHPRPQSKIVGGVGRNGRHADKEKRRKGNKTASTGDCVQGSAQNTSDEKEDAVIESQA